MAVVSKVDIISRIKSLNPDNNSDEYLSLLEDIEDTGTKWESGTDWEQKYRENDADWRKRYVDRFGSGGDPTPTGVEPEPSADREEIIVKTYEELFQEG